MAACLPYGLLSGVGVAFGLGACISKCSFNWDTHASHGLQLNRALSASDAPGKMKGWIYDHEDRYVRLCKLQESDFA